MSLRPLPADYVPTFAEFPHTAILDDEESQEFLEDEEDKDLDVAADVDGEEDMTDSSTEKLIPLEQGLITLSNLPKSRWHNLQNLDLIKQRSKPKDPPAKPKQAPFFLPTVAGLQPKFVADGGDDVDMAMAKLKEGGASRIVNLGSLLPLSDFQKCLLECGNQEECKEGVGFIAT